MNSKEYGIACLLKKESVLMLQDAFPFIDIFNHPHLSLFQFRTNDFSFMNLYKEFLQRIKVSTNQSPKGISVNANNVFLDIADDMSLRNNADLLAEFYFQYCQNKQPLTQIIPEHLNTKEKKLVAEYGIYWIKENYIPHVTLTYDFIPSNLPAIFPKTIQLEQPQLLPIDKYGRIILS